jgi:density-regulated protein DRP1
MAVAEEVAAAEVTEVTAAGRALKSLSVEGDTADAADAADSAAPEAAVCDPRYPLRVLYCATCSMPPELHEYLSRAQLDRCSDWLREHAPETFPDRFPEEAAAAKTAREAAAAAGEDESAGPSEAPTDEGPKVAKPVHQKGTIGKKKKLAPEILIQLAKRKQKNVTVVYGLDLFGIKLTDATKASKKKFASGASIALSADNRDVIEIQGSREEDFAELAHKAFGVPKKSIFVLDPKKKTKRCPFDDDSD